MTYEEKRRYLIRYLLNESGYTNEIPENADDQRQLLRALFNVREPAAIDQEFLKIQNEYLSETVARRGIVDADTLKPVKDRLYLWRGDITRLRIGAIVNACNSGLTGCYIPNHTCIDNQIHSLSGVQLRKKCADIMKIQGTPEPAGKAKITPAYNLPCDYVIHTVAPIVRDRLTEKHCQELASCYRSCMQIAGKTGVKSVAFCCLGTGVFHFPQRRAAEIAIRTVRECLAAFALEKIVFCVFTPEDESIYRALL